MRKWAMPDRWLAGSLVMTLLSVLAGPPARADEAPKVMERVRLSDDGKSFVLDPSGRAFVPWGFNYDHDENQRLIEQYWHDEWPKVEADFREMVDLGANVVRVHLQAGAFLDGPDEPNERNLERLGKLLELAEATGLYLDLTGLGCYIKRDVPAWYDELDEAGRWAAQATFWEAVAERCAGHPAVFCYDLMNEPVVPGAPRKPGDWLGGGFGTVDPRYFVQFITLDAADRPRPEVARAWIDGLVKAVRKHDERTLITVGLVPWSLDRPGLSSGFVPEEIAGSLDFIAVHNYPERDKVDEALEIQRGFAAPGKPVIVEEIFPLKGSPDDVKRFILESRDQGLATGWIGFYWGQTPEEIRKEGTLAGLFLLGWLDLFQELTETVRKP